MIFRVLIEVVGLGTYKDKVLGELQCTLVETFKIFCPRWTNHLHFREPGHEITISAVVEGTSCKDVVLNQ